MVQESFCLYCLPRASDRDAFFEFRITSTRGHPYTHTNCFTSTNPARSSRKCQSTTSTLGPWL